jgi:hypothetical protein
MSLGGTLPGSCMSSLLPRHSGLLSIRPTIIIAISPTVLAYLHMNMRHFSPPPTLHVIQNQASPSSDESDEHSSMGIISPVLRVVVVVAKLSSMKKEWTSMHL